MTLTPNEPQKVNARHDFDVAPLEGYLRTLGLEGEVRVLEFPGGFSNVTYLVRVGARELVMRRAPALVSIQGAHDMSREFRTLVGLAPMWGKSPRPVASCEDPGVIGAKFYLMERAQGIVLRRDSTGLTRETMRRLSESMVDTLVEFHGIDYQKAGLGALGKPDGYLNRQVDGWAKRYAKAKTEERPEIDAIAHWLAENIPTSPKPTLLHNDFKYDNVMVDPALRGVVCVLDWEMCTLGDPLSDLGAALALWQQADDPPELGEARFGPTQLPGNLTRVEVAERYAQKTGADLTALPWYYVLGLYKMLVALEQLYSRFVTGKTTEERYRALPVGIRGMATAAEQVIARRRMG